MTVSNKPVETQAPVRCLIIQLARLGDTLQSLMALRAAKQLYPQLEIYFLAREKFSSAARRIPWIKEVITFPTDQLLGPVINKEKSETQALGDLAQWIAPLVKSPWDMIINWSYSDSSSYLTGILPSRIKLGYTRRRDSTFTGTDGWSHYIQAIVQGKVNQNIHLTDILTTQLLTALQIHIGDPLPEGNAPVTSKGFFSLSLSEKSLLDLPKNKFKKWVSIQLGAGQESKALDPVKWATFIQYVIKKYPEYGVYLLGGKEDVPRAKFIINNLGSQSHYVVSLVGETSFDLWATVVSRSQWLLAGDTAAIHLASVLGTRVLNVSVGPVRYLETGPYGNGHYVITSKQECAACLREVQPNEHTCSTDISAEAIFATWSYASNEWAHRRQISLESHFSDLHFDSHSNSIKVLRSRIRSTIDGGGVSYEPLLKRALDLRDWTSMVVGQIARSWYCGWTPPVGQEVSRELIGPALLQKLRELKDSSDVLSKICLQASKTALLLSNKSSSLKSDKVMNLKDREELFELGQALSELENLIERLAKTHPPLLAFSQMSKVLMHHLKGNQLFDLGKETSNCYKQLNEGVQIFKEWIQFTIDLAKPRTILPTTVTPLNSQTRSPHLSP